MMQNWNQDFEDDIDENELDETTSETAEKVERFRTITGGSMAPLRIDKYLMNHVENITRNKIQNIIDAEMVTVDGKPVKANFKVKGGMEIVMYETRMPEYQEIRPEPIPLNIVYEDDDLMVINKPANMVVHPGCGNYSGTLINGVAWYLNPEQDPNKKIDLPRIGLVHRIDKDTTGLILIAKNDDAMQKLAAQFKAHTVYRRYVGLAWGDFKEEEGTITAHIGRNLRFRKKMDAFPDGSYGKHAVTHYKVLERFLYVTLLEYRLETGRTHQIRVHNRLIGHPLFNDNTYGGNSIVKGTVYAKYKQFVDNCFKIMPRHALHAKELGFVHPRTGEKMYFTSELPSDMQQVIEKWRKYTSTYKLEEEEAY
jgi:23S rRNA pseudouridine1911/1915/1917 synthase